MLGKVNFSLWVSIIRKYYLIISRVIGITAYRIVLTAVHLILHSSLRGKKTYELYLVQKNIAYLTVTENSMCAENCNIGAVAL